MNVYQSRIAHPKCSPLLWSECQVPGVKRIRDPTESPIQFCSTKSLFSNFSFVKPLLSYFSCSPRTAKGWVLTYPSGCFDHCSSCMTLNTFEPINLISLGSSPPLLRPPIVPVLMSYSSSSLSTYSSISSSSSSMSILRTMAMPPVLLLLRLPTGPSHLKAVKCISNNFQGFALLLSNDSSLINLKCNNASVDKNHFSTTWSKYC